MNDEEFLMMIGAAGISGWYGIDLSRKTDFVKDECAVNRSLAELYRKGLIDWGPEKARISEEIKPLFRVLKNADVCITCSSRAMPDVVSGSYCSAGDVVMIERSTTGSDELRITAMDTEEWFAYFEKGGFFPKVIEAPDDMTADHLYPEEDDMVTDFEVRKIPTGKMLENVMLFDCGVYGMIIDNTLHNSVRKMYTPDKIRSIMYSWAGGALK